MNTPVIMFDFLRTNSKPVWVTRIDGTLYRMMEHSVTQKVFSVICHTDLLTAFVSLPLISKLPITSVLTMSSLGENYKKICFNNITLTIPR